MVFETISRMPEDILKHIGVFCITKKMKLQWRIDKLYKKVEELEKRTIDEWIEHIKYSNRYNIKIEKISDHYRYTNAWGDEYNVHENEILNQGYIAHIRCLYKWYIQRIVTSSTPYPRYEREVYTNIIGEKMIAKNIKYGSHVYYSGYDEDDNYEIRCLVFTKMNENE